MIAVVLPRTPDQGDARSARCACPRVVVPEHAVDGQSLLAGADLVVSAGGTMNREAVVLGTPVYTTFAGRLGGVDERLIAEGRLRPLERAEDLRARAQVRRLGASDLRRDPDQPARALGRSRACARSTPMNEVPGTASRACPGTLVRCLYSAC